MLLASGAKATPSTPLDEAISLPVPTPGPTGPVSGLSVTVTAFHTKNKAQTEAALSSSTVGLLLKGENRQRHVSKEKAGKWRRWRPAEEDKGGWRRKWEVLGVEKVEQGCVGEDRQETPGQYKHFLAFALLPQDSSLAVFFMCWETGFEQESAGSPTEHPLQIGTLGPSVAPRMEPSSFTLFCLFVFGFLFF